MNPPSDLLEFAEIVAGDPELLRTLEAEPTTDAFAAKCAALAEGRGFSVTVEEVLDLLRARMIVWLQRHIV